MENPKPGKLSKAQSFTSKTASFYQNQAKQNATIPPSSNRQGNMPQMNGGAPVNAQVAEAATMTQTANVIPGGLRLRPSSSRSFKVALFSLLLSLIGLSVIFAMQVEMKGAGAYLYLLVTVSAFVYIVATMVYVIMSTRRSK